MNDHMCKHGHTYLEHPQCFVDEDPADAPTYERVGFLDIETGGLNGNWDIVISWAIKEMDGDITGRVLDKKEILNWKVLDRNIVDELCEEIVNYDRVIVYYGKDRRHDIPFLRTRALRWDLEFPTYKELFITDVYDIAKNKLRLHRNRLENVANFMHIPAKGHRLDEEIWQRAKVGDPKALNYVWEHNKEDVVTLEEVWKKLNPFVRQSQLSI